MFESKTFAVVGLVSPAAPEISFPSALVVFSLSVSSELNLLAQGGKSSIGTCVHAKSMYWSEAYTLPRQGTRLAPAQFIAEQDPIDDSIFLCISPGSMDQNKI